MSIDEKPGPLVGDLISGQAWLSDWRVDDCISDSINIARIVGTREDNHEVVAAALFQLMSSEESKTTEAGNMKTHRLLTHDRRISDCGATIATMLRTVAERLTTARMQMLDIASHACIRAEQLIADGDASSAQDVYDAARDEINAIGSDLYYEIEKRVQAITIPPEMYNAEGHDGN